MSAIKKENGACYFDEMDEAPEVLDIGELRSKFEHADIKPTFKEEKNDINTVGIETIQESLRRIEAKSEEVKDDGEFSKKILNDLKTKIESLLEHTDFSDLNKLESLKELSELKYLNNLSKLEELEKLGRLKSLNELYKLENLQKLDALKSLEKLDIVELIDERIDEIRFYVERMQEVLPQSKLDEILIKQEGNLEYLGKLDRLEQLDHLDKLNDLNYLKYLSKLDELKNLSLLDKMSELKMLNQLDKLSALEFLQELNALEGLNHLPKLDKLDKLEELKALDQLNNLSEINALENLKELKKLDEMKSLDSLKELQQLQSLANLKQLSSLEELNQLENLGELEKLDNLAMLKDPKVINAIEKINALPLFKDKFHIYVLKSVANTLIDFIKVASFACLIIYLVTMNYNSTIVSRYLPFVGFSDSARVNFALSILHSSIDKAEIVKYDTYVKSRIENEVKDFFNESSSVVLGNSKQYDRLVQIYGYQFKSSDGIDYPSFVASLMTVQAEFAKNRFKDLTEYYLEKNMISDKDLSVLKESYVFLLNNEYNKAFLRITEISDMNLEPVKYGLNYLIYQLYKESPDQLKDYLLKSKL